MSGRALNSFLNPLWDVNWCLNRVRAWFAGGVFLKSFHASRALCVCMLLVVRARGTNASFQHWECSHCSESITVKYFLFFFANTVGHFPHIVIFHFFFVWLPQQQSNVISAAVQWRHNLLTIHTFSKSNPFQISSRSSPRNSYKTHIK